MKRIIYALLCITLAISCQKADNNGDLGGWWKLMQIEEIENDTIIDKSNEDCFWAIQLEMITTNNRQNWFIVYGQLILNGNPVGFCHLVVELISYFS